jgi:hypothetical protein
MTQARIFDLWDKAKLKEDVTVGDLATTVLALIALGALIMAWYQLRGLSMQTRANILLSLDERWESGEVLKLREELNTFIVQVQNAATPQQTAVDLFPASLKALHGRDAASYRKLIRLCGFFETLGYAAKAKYIRVTDLHNLLGSSIGEDGKLFRQHILELQEVRPRLLEHFLWLVDQVEKCDRQPWLERRGCD